MIRRVGFSAAAGIPRRDQQPAWKVGPGFLAQCEEYIAFTQVMGMSKHEAARALRMHDRTLWRVRKFIRLYPWMVPAPPELEEAS